MKCDDVLASLEAGGPIRQYFARRHIAKCEGCAAAAQQLSLLKRQLGEPVQVQTKDRLIWQHVAGNEVEVEPAWSFATPQFAALASLTAALLVIAGFVLWERSTQDLDRPEAVAQGSNAVQVTAWPAYSSLELAEMETGLDRISDDLRRLERPASLLEARGQARALTIMYDPSRSTADAPAPLNGSG